MKANQPFNFDDIEEVSTPVVEPPKLADVKPVAPINEVDSWLHDYKDVKLQDTSTQPQAPAPAQPLPQQPTNNPGNVYLTGKKAGQPRKPRMTVNRTTEQTTLSGEILTGALFITLIDLILPLLIAGINNRFSKGKIKASDLSLTAKQRSELSPIADRVVKQFDFNANPNALLIFSMLGIYGANFALLKFANPPKDEKDNKVSNPK